jgi:hypothetical protein
MDSLNPMNSFSDRVLGVIKIRICGSAWGGVGVNQEY